MPPVRTDRGARPRQDTVSCQSCRVKKLKCDRQKPCSNCRTREFECEYKGGRSAPAGTATDSPDVQRDVQVSIETVEARLQRLERAVFAETSRPMTSVDRSREHAAHAMSIYSVEREDQENKAEIDSNWLERLDEPLPQFSDPFTISIHTLEQTLDADQRRIPARSINIPSYDVVITCLEAYSQHLDAAQHIMHIENTRRVIDVVYSQIRSRQEVDSGALAFILSMCANVGFYWTLGFHWNLALFRDRESALKISTEWVRQALVAMEQARLGSNKTTLEAIQGYLMLTLLPFQLEGFTYRVRMMHATSVAMARDLGLHNTDMPGSRQPGHTQADIINTEVRRKVWWYLSSTDWLLSFMGGPYEGMYSIHSQQTNVKMPRNVTREDLNTKGPDFERSLSVPTVMSYYLQRVKLGIICRDACDVFHKIRIPESADYDVLRMLDAKFESQLQELPRFLRSDLNTNQLREEYGEAYDQQINIQGPIVHVMINMRRCKLHLPFLIRAKSNPQFAFSRRKGLQAARSIFSVRRTVVDDAGSVGAAFLKLGGMLQHLFFATVVLVMDLCTNRQGHDLGQAAEVREALKIMEEGKDSSLMGRKFFDSLVVVLRKHNVKLPYMDQPQAARPMETASAASQVMPNDSATHTSNGVGGLHQATTMTPALTYDNGTSAASAPAATSDPIPGLDSGDFAFDEDMWQDFLEQGPVLGAQDWDAILGDLDMRTM